MKPDPVARDYSFLGAWDDLGRQKEDLIRFKVTQRIGVDVRKPRWMPEFVWKWMWRQVVVTEEPMRVENPDTVVSEEK